MKRLEHRAVALLVAYLGLIEAVHLVLLIHAAFKLGATGVMPFPAVPPADGWSDSERALLVGLGAFDGVIAFVAFVFVFAYFSRSKWWRSVGRICLVGANASALVYAALVLGRSAWTQDPTGYALVVLAYLPVALLSLIWLFGLFGDVVRCPKMARESEGAASAPQNDYADHRSNG